MRFIQQLITILRDAAPEQERKRLSNRRRAIRDRLKWQDSRGSDHECEISFGFDAQGAIREVFCLAAKDGSDMQGIVHDACIAASIALQFGARISDLAQSFGELREEGQAAGQGRPASVIGAVARAGVALELELAEGRG